MDPTFTGPTPSNRASFSTRLIGYLIDTVIIIVISGILDLILKTLLFGQLISIIYFTYFFGSTGQTVGMKLMNIKVQKQDGTKLDYVGGFVRYICMIIAAIPCFLGYFWMLWDPNKETWQDKLTTTEVVGV